MNLWFYIARTLAGAGVALAITITIGLAWLAAALIIGATAGVGVLLLAGTAGGGYLCYCVGSYSIGGDDSVASPTHPHGAGAVPPGGEGG